MVIASGMAWHPGLTYLPRAAARNSDFRVKIRPCGRRRRPTSGATPDDFIADLTVATRAGQLKTSAPCPGERVAKYNQFLRIEEGLSADAGHSGTRFAAAKSFRRE